MQTTTPRLWTRDFGLLVGSTFLVWTCHYLLVLSLPPYAASQMGASPAQVGLLLATLAASAVFSRLAAGHALDRFGRHRIQVAFAPLQRRPGQGRAHQHGQLRPATSPLQRDRPSLRPACPGWPR